MLCAGNVLRRSARQLIRKNDSRSMCVTFEGQGACGSFFWDIYSPLPEPLEAWISIMSDAVPFINNVVVVCPSTMEASAILRLRSRCHRIFPTAQVVPTKIKNHPSPAWPIQPNVTSYSTVSSSSLLSEAACASPLEELPPQSQDIIVFACNVFGREMLWQAPFHITAAHRVLRPHGVLAILGYPLDIHVSAPFFAAEDAKDCLSTMSADLDKILGSSFSFNDRKMTNGINNEPNMLSETKDPKGIFEHRRQREARRAKHILESLSDGHQDIYLPFPARNKRWFESEYAMAPVKLAACYRSLPGYSPCYSPYTTDDEFSACHTRKWSKDVDSNGVRGEKDFIALPTLHGLDTKKLRSSFGSTFPCSSSMIVRRPTAGLPTDPLNLLLEHWDVNCGISPLDDGSIRARALHFVLTCSYRGVNVLEASSFSTEVTSYAQKLLQTSAKKNSK